MGSFVYWDVWLICIKVKAMHVCIYVYMQRLEYIYTYRAARLNWEFFMLY